MFAAPHDRKPAKSFGPLILLMFAGLLGWPVDALADADWKRFVSLYAGQYSDTALIQNLQFDHEFQDSDIFVVSIGRHLARYGQLMAVELEGQFGIHRGRQNQQEINCALTLRWLSLPWDKYVDTSFAFGNGISYATADPPLERENADNGQTAQWLYYILAEWAFAIDDDAQWELFWRIHHRSGVYGRMAGNNAGSNFVGLGLRWRF